MDKTFDVLLNDLHGLDWTSRGVSTRHKMKTFLKNIFITIKIIKFWPVPRTYNLLQTVNREILDIRLKKKQLNDKRKILKMFWRYQTDYNNHGQSLLQGWEVIDGPRAQQNEIQYSQRSTTQKMEKQYCQGHFQRTSQDNRQLKQLGDIQTFMPVSLTNSTWNSFNVIYT